MITDRAGNIIEGSVTADTVADHLAGTAVHQPAEADIQTAQEDTIHATSMDHHTTQINLEGAPHHMHTRSVLLHSQLQNSVKHQAVTLMTGQQQPTNVKTDAPPPTWQTFHLPIRQLNRGPMHNYMQ